MKKENNMRRKIIAIVGNNRIEENSVAYKMAFETGKMLVDNGYRVQSGGLGGIMEAAFRGAHASKHYREGDTIAIIPSNNADMANAYADISIPTGMDSMRNAIVANASAVIAVGGGAGTLSEMAYAWAFKRLLIGFSNVEGWSRILANIRLDHRIRYENIPEDCCYGVQSADEVAKILHEKLPLYNKYHDRIVF